MAYLENLQTKERWPIAIGINHIGRSTKSAIQLQDDTVSQSHCMIRTTNEGCLLLDMNSSNGTFVNHQRIGQQWLKSGDTIELGKISLVYVVENSLEIPLPKPVPPPMPLGMPPPPFVQQLPQMTPPFAPPAMPPPAPMPSGPPPAPWPIKKPAHSSRVSVLLITILLFLVVVFSGIGVLFFKKWGPFSTRTMVPTESVDTQAPFTIDTSWYHFENPPEPVSATIDTQGGEILLPDHLKLVFLADALEESETFTVEIAQETELAGRVYEIHGSGQEGLFNHPVTVELHVPESKSVDDLMVLQQVGSQSWTNLPMDTSDPKVIKTQVMHFSKIAVVENGRTWNQGAGATAGAILSGFIMILGTSATASVSGPMLAVVLVCGGSGWFLGGEAFDSALMDGKAGPIPIDGFQIFYDPEILYSGPRVRIWTNRTNGQLLAMTDPDEAMQSVDQRPTIGRPGRSLGEYITFPDGQKIHRNWVSTTVVPASLFLVGRQLQQTRLWYKQQGYAVPDSIQVVITDQVASTQSSGKEKNAGEWLPDAEILLINTAVLPTDEYLSENLRSTIAHEYFHALWPHNGFSEVFVGAEESAAVTFESLVCHDSRDFLRLYPFHQVSQVLANGLMISGEGEDPAKRGYQLWPWTKFLWVGQGNEDLKAYLKGEMTEELIQGLFTNFCRSLLINEANTSIPDPCKTPLITGGEADSASGWKGVDLKTMAQVCNQDNVQMGATRLSTTLPLSFRVFQAVLPATPPENGTNPVVIRRLSPRMFERIAALRPTQTKSRDIARASREEDLLFDDGALIIPSNWFTNTESADIPFSIIGCLPQFEDIACCPDLATEDNKLLVYQVSSPEVQIIQPIPSVSDPDINWMITFKQPSLGRDLSVQDVIGCYRLLGRGPDGKENILHDFMLDRSNVTADFRSWIKSTHDHSTIQPDATMVSIPAKAIEPYQEIALISVDGLVEEGGVYASSRPIWKQWRGPKGTWMLRDTKVENTLNADPYSQTSKTGTSNENINLSFSPGHFNYSLSLGFERSSEWRPRDQLSAMCTPVKIDGHGGATFTWSSLPTEVKKDQKVPVAITLVQDDSVLNKEPQGAVLAYISGNSIASQPSNCGNYYLATSAERYGGLGISTAAQSQTKELTPPPPEAGVWDITVSVRLQTARDRGMAQVVYHYVYCP